jgi:large subunit ribosomal protein L21
MSRQDTFTKYAIIQIGGKQYQGIEGKTISVEKMEGEAGDTIELTDVLLTKDGENVVIGMPFVGKSVKASIVKQMRDAKIIIYKWKRRTKSRVKNGHRQHKTILRIDSIA